MCVRVLSGKIISEKCIGCRRLGVNLDFMSHTLYSLLGRKGKEIKSTIVSCHSAAVSILHQCNSYHPQSCIRVETLNRIPDFVQKLEPCKRFKHF